MEELSHIRMSNTIQTYIDAVLENFNKLPRYTDVITISAEAVYLALKSGNKAIFCGNGGSAADSQHLAAELMGAIPYGSQSSARSIPDH